MGMPPSILQDGHQPPSGFSYNRGQKGLRIFEALSGFAPNMKTTATMTASPLSPRPTLFVLG